MTLKLFFDTETTGLPDWKTPSGGDKQPHMVQLAALLVDVDTRQIIESMDVIIKPDGWVIPQDVIDIHGITNERAIEVGIPEEEALNQFLALWNFRSRVAHNTTFDNRIIRIATKRYSDESIITAWKEGEYECTGLLSKPIMKMGKKGKYGYKMPKLIEAYEFFTGLKLDNAHNAMDDTRACMSVYFGIQDQK